MKADHIDQRAKFGCSSVDKATPLQSIKGNFSKNWSPKKPNFFTPQKNLSEV